jgi:hypothetical protein
MLTDRQTHTEGRSYLNRRLAVYRTSLKPKVCLSKLAAVITRCSADTVYRVLNESFQHKVL